MKQMKKIGLVGGLGPEATVLYYEGIVREAQKRFGWNYFPYLVINSVNAFEMMPMLDTKDFDRLSGWLLNHLKVLADAGAELAGIASNTPHIVFSRIESESPLPLIPIMRGPVEEAKQKKYEHLLLLGGQITMEGEFYQVAFRSSGAEQPGMD
jgi:aspartate racemase